MNKAIANLEPETEVSTAPHVLQAISAVMTDLAREGIGKDRKNEQQGYKFRGIDDVYNALAPVLARNHLVITPRCLARSKEAVQTQRGGTLFYVNVDVEFTLASALDGSSTVAQMFGEAMDSGDKATNKAMSAAYKYMAMQVFCIPTEGDNDADATTHQLASLEERAVAHLKACAVDKAAFKDAWEQNKEGWKKTLEGPAYARVVKVMKDIATSYPEEEAAPPEAEDLGIGDDDLPEEFR